MLLTRRPAPARLDSPRPNMKPATPRLLSAAFPGLLATLLALAGCGRHEAPAAASAPGTSLPARQVRAEKVVVQTQPATEEVVGTVRSKLRANLESKISGRIESLNVAAGQAVKAGEILARLEVREVQAHLEQAAAAREQAERELKRFTTLLAQNAVTRQEFDAAESRARSTRAAVDEAETLLGYARITAPFSGVITRKLVDVGDLAVPGKPLLELEDPAALRLEADVPEALIGNVTMGASMPVRIPALNREYSSSVREIAPAADSGSRTFLVKFELPSTTELRAGLFGRVAIPAGETKSIRIPASAIVSRGQLELLFVVQDRHAVMRIVRTGRRLGDRIEVLAGLNDGETIVADHAAALLDGQPVEVRP